MAQTISGNFPYFPKIENDPSYGAAAVPFNDKDDAPVQVKDWFHWRGLSQPNYDPSLLQPDKTDFDIESKLETERKAVITNVPFLKDVPNNSAKEKEASWINAFVEAHSDQLLNKDATYNRTCFDEDQTQYSNAKEFDGDEAVGFAQQFCEDIIKSWDETTPIPPSVRDTSDFRNASRV